MNQALVEFWQREAARYESSVHVMFTRTFALAGVGLTALATLAIGVVVGGRPELALVIPFLVILLLSMFLHAIQEILVKALYQFWAERMIARELGTEHGPTYFAWEDIGGRFGLVVRSTQATWYVMAATLLLVATGSVAYFLVQTDLAAVFRAWTANPWLMIWVGLAAAIFVALSVALIGVLRSILRQYFKLKQALGYVQKMSLNEVTERLRPYIVHSGE